MKKQHNRRQFIRTSGIITMGALVASKLNAGNFKLTNDVHSFTLPELPYDFNALEPHIDSLTMEIHHNKHHKAYVDKLNDAVVANKITETSLEKIMGKISDHPVAVRNNGGGHYNHTMFWNIMKPGGGNMSGAVGDAILTTFGSVDEFKKRFNEAAMTRFGSGWAWLTKDIEGKLNICSTPNQDNPLMDISDCKGTPLICLDIWEHAYYLKYQNKRADYVNAFWNVLNWEEVNKRYVGK